MKSKPVVIVSKDGSTREVIQPMRRNIKKIFPSDRAVVNGHRYEIVDGETQIGLKADYRAFGGEPVYNKKNGERIIIRSGEWKAVIEPAYKKLVSDIRNVYADMEYRTQPNLSEYSAKRNALILDVLDSNPDFAGQPHKQFALLAKMLSPRIDDKVSPITITRFGNTSKTAVVNGVKYIENPMAKHVYSTLSGLANGSLEYYKGGIDKQTANRLLKDIVALSRNYYVQERSGMPVDMNKSEKLGYTQPVELPYGYMTDARFLNKGIFRLLRDGDANQKKSAGILYDYLSGKKLVDSSTLYKASKEMERGRKDSRGNWIVEPIPVDQQFMMKIYDQSNNTFKDTEVRDYGITDAYSNRHRGQGGIVKDGTRRLVKDLFQCLQTGE